MSTKRRIISLLVVFTGLAIVVGVVIGLRTFTGENLTEARQIATRLQAAAAANPNPVVGSTTSAATTAGTTAASRSAATAAAATAATRAAGGAGSPTSTVTGAAAPQGSTTAAPTSVRAPTSTVVKPPVTAPSGAPITQPTSAEVQEAINAVHDLVPFFTPTPSQIASAGIQVCTALNAGDSLSQVQAAALNMVGAGSFSSLIPSSETQVAIQTLVSLYCPGNDSKVG